LPELVALVPATVGIELATAYLFLEEGAIDGALAAIAFASVGMFYFFLDPVIEVASEFMEGCWDSFSERAERHRDFYFTSKINYYLSDSTSVEGDDDLAGICLSNADF